MNTVDDESGIAYRVTADRIRATFGLADRGLYYVKNPSRRVGQLRSDGYVRVTIDGEQIYEHVLVYFHYHGRWPDYRLSHWDGDRSNNGIKNLIEEGEVYIRMSKYLGVRYNPATDMWVAKTYGMNFEDILIGEYDTELEAAQAYDNKIRDIFGPEATFVNGV